MTAADVPEYLKNRRDENEPKIIARVRACGGEWFSCSRHEGHDGWVLFAGRWYCCEVKNPRKKWTLTLAESQMKRKVELNGGTYYILQTADDVDRMLE